MIGEWWKRRKEREAAEDRKWVEQAMKKHDVPAEEVVQAVLGESEEVSHAYGSEQVGDWDGSDQGYPELGYPEGYDEDEYAFYDREREYEDEHRRSRAGMFVTLGMVGLVFGSVICGFSYLANSADSAGPKADSGLEALKASIAPSPSVNPLLNGTHIAFTYPAAFDVVTRPKSWANTDEMYTLSSKTDYRKTIQVYVEQVVNPSLDSGFLVRTQHKDKYTPASITVAGEPAVVMVKTDYSERTLYWEHAGNLVIMSATGGGNDMAGWISMIANSLRWLK